MPGLGHADCVSDENRPNSTPNLTTAAPTAAAAAASQYNDRKHRRKLKWLGLY